MSPSRGEIVSGWRGLLGREALRNEARVAIMRVSAIALLVGVDLAMAAVGRRAGLGMAAISSGFLLLAAVIAWAIPRYHRLWFRYAIPVVDACFLVLYGLARVEQFGVSMGFGMSMALTAGVVAATGAMRFDRWAALWSLSLSCAVLVVVLGPHSAAADLIYTLVVLVALGLMLTFLVDRVRRAMEGEQGKVVLGSFLSRALLDKAFSDPFGLVAAPRMVEATVLISDLRGFTAVAEESTPVETFELLNEFQGALAEAVHKCGGTVDKFMGDGMLAVFGAPEPNPKHARCAVEATRAILSAVTELNARNPERAPLRVGIGVHTGGLVAGCLGGGSRLEFTVIGDTVNVAARLEASTKELGVPVAISADTAAQASVPLTSLGEVALRGRGQKVGLFTLPELRSPGLGKSAG
jgi:adenylate cyclase